VLHGLREVRFVFDEIELSNLRVIAPKIFGQLFIG
jgi:hypothetical protein